MSDMNLRKICFSCMSPLDEERGICPACRYDNQVMWNKPHQLTFSRLGNRYLVGRVMGQGGFGITYVGLDLTLNRKVAIKEYYPRENVARLVKDTVHLSTMSEEDEAVFQQGLERFVAEAQTLAKLSDVENVVRVTDHFRANNTAYIVMDYVQGRTVKEMVAAAGGKLPPAQSVALMIPVARALKKIHDAGIIHRDISPDNIIVREADGKPILIDFGAARKYSADESKYYSVYLKQGFAPAEQYSSTSQQGAPSDIYALCATIYYMMTGRPPAQSLARSFRQEELVPPSKLCADMPPRIEAVLLKGMEIDAKDRYADMDALADALAKALAQAEETEKEKRQRLQKKLLPVAGLVLAVAIGAGVWLMTPQNPDPSAPSAATELPHASAEPEKATETDISTPEVSPAPTAAPTATATDAPTPAPTPAEITIQGQRYSMGLTELSLREKKLTNADIEPLKALSDLEILYLSSNQISDISVLSELKNLKKLFLNGNQITDISPLGELRNLQKVDLSDNEITDWSPVAHVAEVSGKGSQRFASPFDALAILEPAVEKPWSRGDKNLHVWTRITNQGTEVIQGTLKVVLHHEDGTAVTEELTLPHTGLQPGQCIAASAVFEPSDPVVRPVISIEEGQLSYADARPSPLPGAEIQYDQAEDEDSIRVWGSVTNTNSEWITGAFMLVAGTEQATERMMRVALPENGLAPGASFQFVRFMAVDHPYTGSILPEDAGIEAMEAPAPSAIEDLRVASFTTVGLGSTGSWGAGELINQGSHWLTGAVDVIIPGNEELIICKIELPASGLAPGEGYAFYRYAGDASQFQGLQAKDLQVQDFSLTAMNSAPQAAPFGGIKGDWANASVEDSVLTLTNQSDQWLTGDLQLVLLEGDTPIDLFRCSLPERGLGPGQTHASDIYLSDWVKSRRLSYRLQDVSVAYVEAPSSQNPLVSMKITSSASSTYSDWFSFTGVLANTGDRWIDGEAAVVLCDSQDNPLVLSTVQLPQGGLAPGGKTSFSGYMFDIPKSLAAKNLEGALENGVLHLRLQNNSLVYREPPAGGGIFGSLSITGHEAFAFDYSRYFVVGITNRSEQWIEGSLTTLIYKDEKVVKTGSISMPEGGLEPGVQILARIDFAYTDELNDLSLEEVMETTTLEIIPNWLEGYADPPGHEPPFEALRFSPLNIIKQPATSYREARWEVLGTVTNGGDQELGGDILLAAWDGDRLIGVESFYLSGSYPGRTSALQVYFPAAEGQGPISLTAQDRGMWRYSTSPGGQQSLVNALDCSKVSVKRNQDDSLTLSGSIQNTGTQSLEVSYNLVAYDGTLVAGIVRCWATIAPGETHKYEETMSDIPSYSDVQILMGYVY